MILLALPGTAMGAGMSISGPATVSEAAGKATYMVQCGDTGSPDPGVPGVPGLPGLPGLPDPGLPGLPDPDLPDPGLPDLPGLPRVLQAVVPNTGLLNVAVADGPAPATQPIDHGVPSLTSLTCSAAATSFTVDVPIVNDVVDEPDEKFTIGAGGALLAEGPVSRRVTTAIVDDDGLPVPIVSLPRSASIGEGNTGTGNLLFNVTLSSAAVALTEVGWRTANLTANQADYTHDSGKVVFQPGQKTKTVSVDVKGDKRDEPDEAFAVTLSDPIAATLGNKGARGVIEDDDGPKVRIGKPKVRGKRLVAKVTCPKSADGCKGRLVGKARKLKLGRKRFNLDGGEKRKLRLKMSKKARRTLGEHALRASLEATASDTSGDTRVITRKVRLKRTG